MNAHPVPTPFRNGSMSRALLRDGVAYMLPGVLSRGLGIVLIPIYTRVLAPADYGAFDLVMVFAGLVHLTVALEISQAVARFYNEFAVHDRPLVASTAWWFTVLAYTGFSGIAILWAPSLSAIVIGRPGLEQEFVLGIAAIWAHGLFHLAHSQFRWQLRSDKYVAASLMSIVAGSAVAVVLTYGLRLGISGLLIGQSVGSLLALVFSLHHLRETIGFRTDPRTLRRLLAFSAPLVPSGIAVFVTASADRLLLANLAGVDAVGVYGIALRFAGVLGILLAPLQRALTPLIYAHHSDPTTPSQLAHVFRAFVGVSSSAAVMLVVAAPGLLATLATDAYAGASAPMGLLVVAVLLGQMYVFAPGLMLAKRTKTVLVINASSAGLNIALNVLFIPWLGLIGAATAKLMSHATVFGLTMMRSHRWYPVPHRWLPLGLAAATAVTVTFTAQWLITTGAPVIGAVLAAGTAQAIAVVLLRLVRPSDLRSAWRQASAWLPRLKR